MSDDVGALLDDLRDVANRISMRNEHASGAHIYDTVNRIQRHYDNATQTDADTRRLLAELEHELGVKGTAAVFRKALALAKAARAALSQELPHADR